MLLQYGGPLRVGNTIELRRDEHSIMATVVWREGLRAGLWSPRMLPLAELIPPEPFATLGVIATSTPSRPHPTALRRHEASRLFGRKLEFIVIVAIAVLIASWVSVMAAMVLFKPLASIAAVL